MLSRGIKAALLRRGTFREVSNDPDAILHALGLVVLAGIARGAGLMDVLTGGAKDPAELVGLPDRIFGIWVTVMTLMVGWILWATLVYLIESRLMGGEVGYRQTVRVIGICYGPGVLFALGQVPNVGDVISLAGFLWVLVAAVVAVREALAVDWIGAFFSTLLGWFLCLLVLPWFLLSGLSS
jgi:hypothetical protein